MAVIHYMHGKEGHDDMKKIPVTAGPTKALGNPCDEYLPTQVVRNQ
jgi:hypothetical protein